MLEIKNCQVKFFEAFDQVVKNQLLENECLKTKFFKILLPVSLLMVPLLNKCSGNLTILVQTRPSTRA